MRVVLGGPFVYHGVDKFETGIDMVEQAFDGWGVAAPSITAPGTAIVAGAALVVGLGTRIAAVLLSVVLLGALLYVKTDVGIISTEPIPGAELDLSVLAGLVTLIVLGAATASVDQATGLDAATT